jgi:hypothetical protein
LLKVLQYIFDGPCKLQMIHNHIILSLIAYSQILSCAFLVTLTRKSHSYDVL